MIVAGIVTDKGAVHAVGIEDLLVIAQREIRRRLGGEIDGRRAFDLCGRGVGIGPVRLHNQRAVAGQCAGLAYGKSGWRGTASAKLRHGARALLKDIAFEHEQPVALHRVACRFHGEILRHGQRRQPPARCGDLIAVTKAGDHEPDSGDQPDDDQKHDRDMHRPCERGLCTSNVIHNVLPSQRGSNSSVEEFAAEFLKNSAGPSPHLLSGLADVPDHHRQHDQHAWRMFQIITGSTISMITKATAVARPSSRNM